MYLPCISQAIFIINRNRTFLGGSVPRRTQDVVSMLGADEMVISHHLPPSPTISHHLPVCMLGADEMVLSL
jgi:hypothetical protein